MIRHAGYGERKRETKKERMRMMRSAWPALTKREGGEKRRRMISAVLPAASTKLQSMSDNHSWAYCQSQTSGLRSREQGCTEGQWTITRLPVDTESF